MGVYKLYRFFASFRQAFSHTAEQLMDRNRRSAPIVSSVAAVGVTRLLDLVSDPLFGLCGMAGELAVASAVGLAGTTDGALSGQALNQRYTPAPVVSRQHGRRAVRRLDMPAQRRRADQPRDLEQVRHRDRRGDLFIARDGAASRGRVRGRACCRDRPARCRPPEGRRSAARRWCSSVGRAALRLHARVLSRPARRHAGAGLPGRVAAGRRDVRSGHTR